MNENLYKLLKILWNDFFQREIRIIIRKVRNGHLKKYIFEKIIVEGEVKYIPKAPYKVKYNSIYATDIANLVKEKIAKENILHRQ